MKKMALLVVDVQNLLVDEKPYHFEIFIEKVQALIQSARENEVEVIYVRHDDGEGELVQGAPAWEIYEKVAPNPEERIIDKQYNSAFHKTPLEAYLKSKQIEMLILTGMQTEYCIDATLKSAFDLGYDMIVPLGANTTFDNSFLEAKVIFEFYNHGIWENRFAKLISVEEVIRIMKGSKTI